MNISDMKPDDLVLVTRQLGSVRSTHFAIVTQANVGINDDGTPYRTLLATIRGGNEIDLLAPDVEAVSKVDVTADNLTKVDTST